MNHTATTEIYTLSLHDALPIWARCTYRSRRPPRRALASTVLRSSVVSENSAARSEEHTSELQSRRDLVCRLLLEKKKKSQHGEVWKRKSSAGSEHSIPAVSARD